MVRLRLKWRTFDVWVQKHKSLCYTEACTFGCREVLFYQIELAAPVFGRFPLIQLEIVILLKENGRQCICESIEDDHV